MIVPTETSSSFVKAQHFGAAPSDGKLGSSEPLEKSALRQVQAKLPVTPDCGNFANHFPLNTGRLRVTNPELSVANWLDVSHRKDLRAAVAQPIVLDRVRKPLA
jgi:hypothetical protein